MHMVPAASTPVYGPRQDRTLAGIAFEDELGPLQARLVNSGSFPSLILFLVSGRPVECIKSAIASPQQLTIPQPPLPSQHSLLPAALYKAHFKATIVL